MKLTFTILLIFAFIRIGNTQNILPDSISLKIYLGGDYYNKELGKGAADNIDSIIYVLNEDKDHYTSEKIFQVRKIFMYIDEDFNTANMNKDSTMTIYSNSWADITQVKELMHWSSFSNYEEKILEFNYSFDDGDILSSYDTLLVPEGLTIEDIGINEDAFVEECKYFNSKKNTKKRCKKIDYGELFDEILNENFGMKVVSSYIHYIQLSFRSSDDTYKITQQYSGEFNLKWDISINDQENIYVINPHLNEIIYNLIPSELSVRNRLLEFKDKSKIFQKID